MCQVYFLFGKHPHFPQLLNTMLVFRAFSIPGISSWSTLVKCVLMSIYIVCCLVLHLVFSISHYKCILGSYRTAMVDFLVFYSFGWPFDYKHIILHWSLLNINLVIWVSLLGHQKCISWYPFCSIDPCVLFLYQYHTV